MPRATVYRPDAILQYDGALELRLNGGVLEFQALDDCMITQTPTSGPQYTVRFRKGHRIKTNMPFFVEEDN